MDGKVCHFVLARNVIILAEWWTTDFLECNELRTVHSKWVEVLLEYYSSIPTPIATFIDVQVS